MKNIKLWLLAAVCGLFASSSPGGTIPISQLNLNDENSYATLDGPASGSSEDWLADSASPDVLNSCEASVVSIDPPAPGLPLRGGIQADRADFWPSLILIGMGSGVLLSLRSKAGKARLG